MMFDLFAEHRHFGVVEFSAWLAIHQLGNQHLATIMFDMRFVEDVVLDLAAKCRIENLLLNHRVNDEFGADLLAKLFLRSEEHTSELQSLMRISYAVFCLKKTKAH